MKATVSRERRWPQWVYDSGGEPDVRFSFANERTFLAWIRTSLALLAAGVALDALDLSLSDPTQEALAMLMVLLGLMSALASWVRWARAERAIRRGEALPSLSGSAILVIGVSAAAVVILLGL
jgi:putative membrane protein